MAAWQAAGLELFSGVNVPSKAFGEFVEHTYETPRLAAAEVKAMLDEGRDMVIVDSRPFEEYHRMNIPTATDMPGAELAFRIHDMAPDPETFVVVNCAGRTRSIIGTQSLINAGIPNPVAALKDGTMGWHLAGFELEHGSTRSGDQPSAAGMDKALTAAARVADRFEVPTVTPETVEQWRQNAARTTYLLDVRSPAEYAEGHLPEYRNAPGGQLVQATDEYVAVRNAWLVLADDVGVRATMTASWLIQMGWPNVYVLEGGIGTGPLESGQRAPTVLGDLGRSHRIDRRARQFAQRRPGRRERHRPRAEHRLRATSHPGRVVVCPCPTGRGHCGPSRGRANRARLTGWPARATGAARRSAAYREPTCKPSTAGPIAGVPKSAQRNRGSITSWAIPTMSGTNPTSIAARRRNSCATT